MIVLFYFHEFPLLPQEELSYVTSLILYTTCHYQYAQQPCALVKHFTDQQQTAIQALSWSVPTYSYRWAYLPLHNYPWHIHLGYTFASARHDRNNKGSRRSPNNLLPPLRISGECSTPTLLASSVRMRSGCRLPWWLGKPVMGSKGGTLVKVNNKILAHRQHRLELLQQIDVTCSNLLLLLAIFAR